MKLSAEIVDSILELNTRGCKTGEICRITRTSYYFVAKCLTQHGRKACGKTQSKYSSRKIDRCPGMRSRVIELAAAGLSYRAIGIAVGISGATVASYCRTYNIKINTEALPFGMAKCSRCRMVKRTSDFSPSKWNIVRGVESLCKACKARKWQAYSQRPDVRERRKKQQARYNNDPTVKARRAEQIRERRRADIVFKLNDQISSSLRHALRNNKNGYHWESLTGYTLDDLMQHLQGQFTEGMTWENYGQRGWTIDHIIPISVFNFTQPTDIDFQRCWALENLRPMWHVQNIAKSNRLQTDFQPSLALGVA